MGGTQSTYKITAQDRVILDLKIQCDKLKQYQKRIQVIVEREREIAKQELAAGHKDRALVALRRRKYQQGLLVRTDSQLEALEQLISTIEFSLVQVWCVPLTKPYNLDSGKMLPGAHSIACLTRGDRWYYMVDGSSVRTGTPKGRKNKGWGWVRAIRMHA